VSVDASLKKQLCAQQFLLASRKSAYSAFEFSPGNGDLNGRFQLVIFPGESSVPDGSPWLARSADGVP